MNTNALRTALENAAAKLVAAGYSHSHSIMAGAYGGMVFLKTLPDTTCRRFVLNIDTYKSLPTE